jgi:hypothetical protein
MRLSRLLMVVTFLVVIVVFASQAARFLVVDDPVKSDAIVVLAGETNFRPALGAELLREGVAPHAFLDAETRDKIYNERLTDIAQRYIDGLGETKRISVCPVSGFSTYGESNDIGRCLQSLGVHRVLVVTSEFHTRRALMIARHRLPQYEIHMAAARNPLEFGEAWWTKREWAKTTFDEWTKLIWFEMVDRWQ